MQFIPMALSAVSQIASGYAAGAQADADANTARQNADIARQQTDATEEQNRRKTAMQRGDMRARSIETGFDASSGTLADLQIRSAAEMELDVLTSRYEGSLRALSFDNEAASAKARGKSARRSGYLNAAGSIMGSMGNYMGSPRIGPLAPVENKDLRG